MGKVYWGLVLIWSGFDLYLWIIKIILSCFINHLFIPFRVLFAVKQVKLLNSAIMQMDWFGHRFLVVFWLYLLIQDLLEDPAVISAIDEETEFNALVVFICPWFVPLLLNHWIELKYLSCSLCHRAGGRGSSTWIIVRQRTMTRWQIGFCEGSKPNSCHTEATLS